MSDSLTTRDERIRSTALDKALNARRLGEDDQVTVARAEAFRSFLDSHTTATDDWGPGEHRIMRLSTEWSEPWRGMQFRVATTSASGVMIEIRREASDPEADHG